MHEILRDSPLPPQTNLLIVVDQFEEIFRYRQPDTKDELATFVWLLLESSKHPLVYVVITIRSDFMSDCASFSDLPEAISEGVFLVPYLRREQLQQAIENPAKVYDGQVEARLINQLLNGMKNDPKQLPVLQHALMRMWKLAQADNPQQPLLTFQHYEKIGQLAGALSSHADEAYSELATLSKPAQPQQVAQILFRRLCERDPARRDTRSPVNLSEVTKLAGLSSSWEDMVPVLDIFRQADRHFLTPGSEVKLNPETVIDIGHESLIEHWQRLNKWVEAEAKSADTYRRLEDSACRWEAGKAELLSGVELETTSKWFKREKPTAIWAKRYGKHFELAKRFLEESEAAWRQKEEEKEAARRKEKKRIEAERIEAERQQKLRIAIGTIVGLLIVTGIVTIFAIWARVAQNEAEKAKTQAEKAKKKREVELFESHLTHATLLTRYDDYAGAKDTLGKTKALDSVDVDRRHTRNLLEWFNKLMSTSPKQTYQDAGAPLFAVALSSDGNYLAAVGEKGTTVLFDTQDSRLLRYLEGHNTGKSVRTVVFHPQDQWFASAGEDGQIIFWSLSKIKDVPDPDKVKLEDIILNKKEEKDVDIRALAVSSDGKYLASGGTDKKVTLWSVENIKKIRKLRTFGGHKDSISDKDSINDSISDLAFSPDGKLLASASYDKKIILWSIQNRRKVHFVHTLEGHTDPVRKVAFSPDGKRLASSSSDKTIRLWKVDSGKQEHIFLGHKNTVFDIAFTADGQYLVSAGDDRTLRLWDTQYGVTMRILQGHTAGVNSIAISQGDIFSVSDDRTVKRWDMSLPQQQIVDLSTEPASVAIAPDGSSIAVGFSNGALRLYPLPPQSKSDLLWEQPTAHNDGVTHLVFSSDSTLLASASADETAKLWQVNGGKLQQILNGHTEDISAVAFSSDNHTIATASYDGQIGLFTVGTEQKTFYNKAHEGEEINAVSFNKDGTQLLSTSDHGVRLWDFSSNTLTLTLSEEYPKTKDFLIWSTLSPDDNQIASVGRDQIVHIYSTQFKNTLYYLSGHESTIYRVIYSPDGKQVATISADASLRLWDLHNKGSELFTLRLPTKEGGTQWDFDFRCILTDCWIAVPLIPNKLMLYRLGNIYEKNNEKKLPEAEPENEQIILFPSYSTGPYKEGGTVIFGGFKDYITMLNEEENGINGIKLNVEECETGYEVARTVECYEKYHEKATILNLVSTNATYALTERATRDEIPIITVNSGRSDAIAGDTFKYVFPLLTTYLNQNTAKIKFIGKQLVGGMDKLKGQTIANVYHHSEFGAETFEVLEKQAKKYKFKIKYFPIMPPGLDQRSTWKQIKRLDPDWIIFRGWGEMISEFLKEAKINSFSADHIIGVSSTGFEEVIKPAGADAKCFISTNFYGIGKEFIIIQNINNYLYKNSKGNLPQKYREDSIGSTYYNRGIVTSILVTEAIRTAQEEFGHQPLTGEQVRWGLEHLNITPERLKELGAEGLFSPIKTSCANHEGSGKVIFQQWDGNKWVIISDWIEPDYNMTRPLVENSVKKYVEEKGITPRDCSQEE